MNISSMWDAIKKIPLNMMTLAVFLLAAAILFLAAALFGFTYELSMVRRDLPKTLDRIDVQIGAVKQIASRAESSGKKFSTGINKDISSGINNGISEGLVNLPVNTVTNVGSKLTNTALTTGKETYNFWQAAKDRLMFWSKKPPVTGEASSKKKK